MTVAQAERTAITAGAVTIVAGTALTLAPAHCAKSIGMEDHADVMRAIGITDLIVAPGLLAGRPRWPWLIARTALNAGLVAAAVRYRRALGNRNSRLGAATFVALTVNDGVAAATLRSAGR